MNVIAFTTTNKALNGVCAQLVVEEILFVIIVLILPASLSAKILVLLVGMIYCIVMMIYDFLYRAGKIIRLELKENEFSTFNVIKPSGKTSFFSFDKIVKFKTTQRLLEELLGWKSGVVILTLSGIDGKNLVEKIRVEDVFKAREQVGKVVKQEVLFRTITKGEVVAIALDRVIHLCEKFRGMEILYIDNGYPHSLHVAEDSKNINGVLKKHFYEFEYLLNKDSLVKLFLNNKCQIYKIEDNGVERIVWFGGGLVIESLYLPDTICITNSVKKIIKKSGSEFVSLTRPYSDPPSDALYAIPTSSPSPVCLLKSLAVKIVEEGTLRTISFVPPAGTVEVSMAVKETEGEIRRLFEMT